MKLPPKLAALIAEQTGESEKKPSKYRNVKVEIGGILFDSKAEGRRYEQLRTAEKAGAIIDLRRQVKYRLEVNGKRVGSYTADFEYVDTSTGATITEDVKGGAATQTAVYRLKRRMMKAQYGITITEVGA